MSKNKLDLSISFDEFAGLSREQKIEYALAGFRQHEDIALEGVFEHGGKSWAIMLLDEFTPVAVGMGEEVKDITQIINKVLKTAKQKNKPVFLYGKPYYSEKDGNVKCPIGFIPDRNNFEIRHMEV